MKQIVFLLSMLLLVCVDGYAVGVEDVAPDFNTSNLKGNHISYSGQLKGKKPVYLVFWATW